MGVVIGFLKRLVEDIANGNKLKLYIGGGIITFILIFLSGFSGWLIERLFIILEIKIPIFSRIFFIFILSSALASRSLSKSVMEIINIISKKTKKDNIYSAREKLSLIVGRDVEHLDKNEILRATAETASENSVDGIFAPLFWMFIGIIFWQFNQLMPGPLTMAWIYKASSTIDSMLGYKEGNLRWLGYIGAKLDDILTWFPSRIVLITLPFCCRPKQSIGSTISNAWKDGSMDSSPNSGISEAIFAYCAGVSMGGINFYKGKKKIKSIIAKPYPIASATSVKKILNLIIRLEFLWVIVIFLTIKFINF